ncbi:UDP-glucuronate 4-epimerase [Gillisia mitskevichiae]|uniref:UDP-glucuronate 4-epimerase n=1 Tax=Gillisia mitskevichiae TaxID=270921 RepID=A0A495PMC2_9FLAO|nr:NAD-dependent epimerase [Gillisia mitskevichiae]RKS50618.1 UDP-glucuronate 4-epimerase [Gillisia mitskevichiae]
MQEQVKNKVLVTGAAGFIGFHLAKKLLDLGFEVVGLDNINDYYEVNLKLARLKELGIEKKVIAYNEILGSEKYSKFQFIKLNLEDREQLPKLFKEHNFKIVCNLAAQAGVRYSLENPEAYIDSNVVGFLNILECCRNNNIEHLIYATSSSVYGQNKKIPFSVKDNVDHPISLYAATKKSNELMAYTYSHLFNFKTTGLRFFTVYGPWGRPDMAMFLFTDAIIKGKPIKVFNNGNLERDFTFIDDIVDGVLKIVTNPENQKPNYSLYNIGNSKPVKILDFIDEIEKQLGLEAQKEMLPMQAGDVERTWADVSDLKKDFGYKPNTSIEKGVGKYIDWYKAYYEKL